MKNLVCVEYGSELKLSQGADKFRPIVVTEFDNESLKKFIEEFTDLNTRAEVGIIPIIVSSYGGQVHVLFSMIDIIRSTTKTVATIGIGKSMSCGAVLLAAGTKGYRFSTENNDIMLHEVSSFEWGKLSEMKNGIEHTKELNKRLFDFLSNQSTSKRKLNFDEEFMKRGNTDWFLSSNEYKKLGLIDHVGMPSLVKDVILK